MLVVVDGDGDDDVDEDNAHCVGVKMRRKRKRLVFHAVHDLRPGGGKKAAPVSHVSAVVLNCDQKIQTVLVAAVLLTANGVRVLHPKDPADQIEIYPSPTLSSVHILFCTLLVGKEPAGSPDPPGALLLLEIRIPSGSVTF